MKGERTLVDIPFRYGGFFHDYEKDVEQWSDVIGKTCWCCGGRMRNAYGPSGTLLRRNYPYVATFKYIKGKYKGLYRFRALCRACAYNYGRGVIEMDGNTYIDYYAFNEDKCKEDKYKKEG